LFSHRKIHLSDFIFITKKGGRLMGKKVILFVLVAGMFCFSFSQNARVDGFGGTGIISDITNIYGIPAYTNDYTDILQATAWNSPTGVQFGPAFGIKSLGPYCNLGFYIRREGMMRSDFYNYSKNYLSRIFFRNIFSQNLTVDDLLRGDSKAMASGLPQITPSLPHLLLGMNFGKVTLGIDGYYEYAGKKLDVDTLNLKLLTDRSVSNLGAKLSININLEPFFISPVVGYGMPKMSGSAQRTDAKATLFTIDTTKNAAGAYLDSVGTPVPNIFTKSAASSNELWYTAGSEIWFKIKNFNFVVGGFFTQENYNMRSDSLRVLDTLKTKIDSTQIVRYNQYTSGYDTLWQKDTSRTLGVANFNIGNGSYTNRFVDAYAGFTADVYEGLMLVGEYCLTWKKMTRYETQALYDNFYNRNRVYVIDEYLDALVHTVFLSVEKPVRGFWKIDQLTPRAGVRWTLLNIIAKSVPSYPPNATTVPYLATSTQRYPDSTTTPTLTLGLGVRMGIATLDTRVEIGQWNGLLSGPVAAEGTLTLDFKALPKPAAKKPAKEALAPAAAPAEKKVEAAPAPAPKQEVQSAPEPAQAKPAEKAAQEPAAAPQAKPAEKAAQEPAAAQQAKPADKTAPAPAAASAPSETKKAPAAAPAPAKTEKKP
jgi:hypothetical protein